MHISKLFIYPVKSCAGFEVDLLRFDQYGPIDDRRFLIVSPDGDFVTQRHIKHMAFIEPTFQAGKLCLSVANYGNFTLNALPPDSEAGKVRVWDDDMTGLDCGDEVAQWLEGWLKAPCRLVSLPSNNQRVVNKKYGSGDFGLSFSDGAPLLVVHQASLNCLSEFIGEDIDVRRFRPNVLIDSHEAAFSELTWSKLITDNSTELRLFKPCERCVIPTRNPVTQEREPKVIEALKKYCLIDRRIIFGQNAVFNGKVLTVGDDLTLI